MRGPWGQVLVEALVVGGRAGAEVLRGGVEGARGCAGGLVVQGAGLGPPGGHLVVQPLLVLVVVLAAVHGRLGRDN